MYKLLKESFTRNRKLGFRDIALLILKNNKKHFYFKRWGAKEEHKALKALVQIENFMGITQMAINQDFFATLFMLNITNRIISDIEDEDTQNDTQIKPKKYLYKVNRNYSIGTIKDNFIYLLLTNGDIELFFKQIEEKLKKCNTY